MERFTVEIAGVPVEIRCRFPENREFLRDYLSGREPSFAVCPTNGDLEKIQADFDRMNGVHHAYSEVFLENNAIHALLAEKLVAHNVLLMHGSALCMDGNGIIFTAPSGVGKSTHARLWREAFGNRVWMINDDKPMLRIGEDGVTVYGTPWDGKHRLSRNASAPLKAIVHLTRSNTNHVEPMERTDAFGMLMKQCPILTNPAVMRQVLALEERLLSAIRFYTSGCNMSTDAARVVCEGIKIG